MVYGGGEGRVGHLELLGFLVERLGEALVESVPFGGEVFPAPAIPPTHCVEKTYNLFWGVQVQSDELATRKRYPLAREALQKGPVPLRRLRPQATHKDVMVDPRQPRIKLVLHSFNEEESHLVQVLRLRCN